MFLLGAQLYEEAESGSADFYRALRITDKACNGGELLGCAAAAQIILEDNEIADKTRAVRLLNRACNGSEFVACYLLSDLYLEGTGVQKDINHAKTLLQKSCDGGYMDACYEL